MVMEQGFEQGEGRIVANLGPRRFFFLRGSSPDSLSFPDKRLQFRKEYFQGQFDENSDRIRSRRLRS